MPATHDASPLHATSLPKPEFSSPFLLVFEEPEGVDPLEAMRQESPTRLSLQLNGVLSTADKTSWAQTENDSMQLSTY